MTLTVTHVDGPLAGQSQEFDDSKARIVFGRDETVCDVVFPGDYNIVAREHFALSRKFAGSYEVDLNKANYVEVDGKQAYESDQVPQNCRLRLGGPDGPLLEISIAARADAGGPPPTMKQKTMRHLPEMSRRNRRIAVSVGVVAILAILGLAGYTVMQHQEWDNLASSIEDVRETQVKQAKRLLSEDVLARLKDSVYLVVRRDGNGKESGFATAFAIGPKVLATNAHVAEVVLSRERGISYYVSKLNGSKIKRYRVTKAVMHPGYKAFKKFQKDADLMVPQAKGGVTFASFAPSYDVAVLLVGPNAKLEPTLKLADNATLHQLASGDALAYAGFPMENLTGGAALALAPEPQLKIGVMTSATNFFNFPAVPNDRQLLRHSMGATGGASGSPIINSAGEVVGTLNGGNLFHVSARTTSDGGRAGLKRIPNAVNINFGQRADLIEELVSGTAHKRLAAYRRSWERDAAQFTTWRTAILAHLDKQWRSKAKGKKPRTVLAQKGKLITLRFDVLGFGVRKLGFGIRKKIKVRRGHYGFQAISNRGNNIDMYLYLNKKVVRSDNAKHPFPNFHYRFTSDATPEIIVIAPGRKGVAYELKMVKLD